jgi:superfamily I DNA and/or RNA helicase
MNLLPIPVCIVDESSQATEPSLCHVLKRELAKLCLVGDDKQLPPVVKQVKVREAIVCHLQLNKALPTPA